MHRTNRSLLPRREGNAFVTFQGAMAVSDPTLLITTHVTPKWIRESEGNVFTTFQALDTLVDLAIGFSIALGCAEARGSPELPQHAVRLSL